MGPVTRAGSISTPERSRAIDALERLADALARVEALLPPAMAPEFATAIAFRWRKRRYFGFERGEGGRVIGEVIPIEA